MNCYDRNINLLFVLVILWKDPVLYTSEDSGAFMDSGISGISTNTERQDYTMLPVTPTCVIKHVSVYK
jgi:hypothetical protein